MRESEATIFLVSPFIPYPPARGIELRIFRLLTWMHAAGYKVVLIIPADVIDDDALHKLRPITHAIHWTSPALRTRVGMKLPLLRKTLWEPLKSLRRVLRNQLEQTSGEPQRPVGKALNYNRDLLGDGHPLGDSEIKAWFAPDKLIALVGKMARGYRPYAVIVEYIFSAPVFAALPKSALKIIDTIDVFSRKEEQVLSFGIADPLACSEEEERCQLLTADVIVAIQARELTLLQKLVPEREVILAGIDLHVSERVDNDSVIAGSVAVVASDNALNVHGLKAFLAECWPTLRATCPQVTLHVVGRVGETCQVVDSAIRYSGWVDNLDRVYREASVVINPTIAGTGLKIKSVQALAHGKPLVAWTNGVEGLRYAGAAPYVECSSWEQFGTEIVRLLRSDADRLELAERALAYAREEFSAECVYSSLADRLDSAKSDYSRSTRQ